MAWRVAYNIVRRRPLYRLTSLTIRLTVHFQHIVHGDLSGVCIIAMVPGPLLILRNE